MRQKLERSFTPFTFTPKEMRGITERDQLALGELVKKCRIGVELGYVGSLVQIQAGLLCQTCAEIGGSSE